MKKLLSISLVAVFAVSPLMARAERSVSVVNYANPVASNTVATTSYVEGAYKAASDRIDALVTDTNVNANGNYIDANESVAHNLVELDNAVKLNEDAIGVLNGDETTNGSVAKKIADAISTVNDAADALEDRVEANEGAIATLNGNESTAGSVAYAVAQEKTAREAADEGLQGAITAEATARAEAVSAEATAREAADTALGQRIDNLNTSITNDFATKTGVVSTINSASASGTFNVAQTWGSSQTTPFTVNSDVAVVNYVAGAASQSQEPANTEPVDQTGNG